MSSLKLLFGAAAATLACAQSAYAIDVNLSGHVSKAIMMYDDGKDTETNFVDNDKMISSFVLRGTQELDNGLKGGIMFMHQSQSTPSNGITQNTAGNIQSTPTAQAGSAVELYSRVSLGHNQWGTLHLGRQATSTNGIAEIDLAGANDVLGSGIDRFGGGLQVRRSTGAVVGDLDGDATNETITSFFDNMDGIRQRSHADYQDALRYDTPVFKGVQASFSAEQGGTVEGTLRYECSCEDLKVKAGLGYIAHNRAATTANDNLESTLAGSISAKHSSGLGVTLAGGKQSLENESNGNDDPTYYYAKVGYSWDAFEVAADYGKFNDMIISTTTDHEATAFGFAGQYNMGHGVSLAGMYRNEDVDITGIETDDIDIYVLNLAVRF